MATGATSTKRRADVDDFDHIYPHSRGIDTSASIALDILIQSANTSQAQEEVYDHHAPTEREDRIIPNIPMGVKGQWVGSNYMTPYNPTARSYYLGRFTRYTLDDYNEAREWPRLVDAVPNFWIYEIVRREQDCLRKQCEEAASTQSPATKVSITKTATTKAEDEDDK
jgi:hypothetical protein